MKEKLHHLCRTLQIAKRGAHHTVLDLSILREVFPEVLVTDLSLQGVIVRSE